ncbi:MAG: hypothetical protein HYY84_05700 [Deltaproteobacteria bacterium]|nr:hypothetical protein [Deltaproteobacteria bacterium]
MMKVLLTLVVFSFPFAAIADDAAQKPAGKPDQLPTEVKEDKPAAAPDVAQDPSKAATAESEKKYNAWVERFKAKHPKAAEHYLKLRQGVLDAKTKLDANKGDAAAKRELLVARRKLHGFWVGFRGWQIRHAREEVARWRKDVARHRDIMRKLEKEIVK